MSRKNPYTNFSKYVLRTPLFSVSSYKELTSERHISEKHFKKLCNNPIVKEAIFLASPPLYHMMNKWLNDDMKDKQKEEKLKSSILKYVSRMSSRCTPFGIFAGCSVGNFSDKTDIELSGAINNKRYTRLDMRYLVDLSKDLIKVKEIRKQLLFFPNTTVYNVGHQLRYVEYKFTTNIRHHHIAAVDDTVYLDHVLAMASEGALLGDLAKSLVNDDISLEEAKEYIEELVSNQLLVSELEPATSGPEFLEQMFSVLQKMKGIEDILTRFQKTNRNIKKIDSTIGNNTQTYFELIEILKKLGTTFQAKSIFHTSMALTHQKNTLNNQLIEDLKKGFTLLNKITLPPTTPLLHDFGYAFWDRFEGREMPLSKALDVETGVGYIQTKNAGDINPLVDDLTIPNKQSKHNVKNIKWTAFNTFFQQRLLKAIRDNAYTIEINEEDFKDYDASWDDLPDTVSFMVEIIKGKDREKIKIIGSTDSTAANLLGRFCYGNKELHTYVQEIVDVETKINKDNILAEINHHPYAKALNVIMRPEFREYEIPYLAKSLKPKANQIPLDDLMVSIKKERIILRSKKHNQEIFPRLTNAHNFQFNTLPIYHFLGDMQTHEMRKRLKFDWGPFAYDYEFLPRIEYHNLILHVATWNLKKNHIKDLLKHLNDDDKLYDLLNQFRERLQMPQYILLSDYDNELLVNLENLTSVRMLLNEVGKRSSFRISEFLFSESGIVKKGNTHYTNQAIISFYNEEKLKHNSSSNSKS